MDCLKNRRLMGIYEPRRMVQQEQIKRVLSASELPKLGENIQSG